MKRIHSIFFKSITFYLFLCLFLAGSTEAFSQWAGGSGTLSDPYQISNITQLTALQTSVNSGTNYSGKYLILTTNLNLSGNEWTPIGTSSSPFKGNFDGNNHIISGLYISQSTNDIGLFGYLNTATVSNLGISTATGGVRGGTNVGILAGSQNGGTISNCFVMGSVTGADVIGGMVGNQPGGTPTIMQCFAITDITGTTNTNGVGGLVGILRGNLNNSYAYGDIKGINAIGGLVGTCSTNGVIKTSYATGNTISTSSSKSGGLVGNMSQGTASIQNSVALNNTLTGSSSVGRVAGAKNSSATLVNNYASNSMSVIIGNTPKIITSNTSDLDGGTQSKSTLKTQTFYNSSVSWSINSINDNSKTWNISENICFPYLQTQSSPVSDISFGGGTLQGSFRSDVTMDSILIYVKTGTAFVRLDGTANINNGSHTWTYNDPAIVINGIIYIFAYESGKAWPSYPITYTLCGIPITFDTTDKEIYSPAINLQTCITNLQNAGINDIQFSKEGGTSFDENIIPSPATYSVDGTQTIYARATSGPGCQSAIQSFQIKQIGTLLFREDFGTSGKSEGACSTTPLGSNITTYKFGGSNGDYHTNGIYGMCSQLSSNYNDYFYYGEASYDHTNPGKGHSLIVNADFEPGKFYTLKINNLCPGTRLYFSAWVFNMVNPNAPNTSYYMKQNVVFNDPDLLFELTDANGAILAQYNTQSIPKVTDPATNWRPYGFEFTTQTSSVTLTLYNNGPGGNGNDLMIDDIEVYTYIPSIVINGPLSYCMGDPLDLTVKNYDSSPLSQDMKVNWLFSENGDMGPHAKWDTISSIASGYLNMPIQKSGYLRAVVGTPGAIDGKLFNCCSISDPTHVMITPELMYWRRNSQDNDWNNPQNWVDANDSILNAVPSKCTDVHIPGNARHYPALDDTHTLRTENYGEPQCRDITYHFGAETAKPHYLDYRKAYIQYNFGYFNGNNFVSNGDLLSASAMERGHWYALAAPLKNIVSSDFSVGGFPNFWQQGFKSSLDHNSTLNGDWYTPENTAALEIGARQNYAISVWAGEYLPGVLGEDNHQNLNALNGILQMPYFEDAATSAKHRIHEYNTADSTSRFYYYYYDRTGLPVENSFYDGFQRGSKSYRFVFEDNNNKPMNDFAVNVPAGSEIMIGNPFISSLDFKDFYDKNSAVMENYYRLFVKNNFITYSIADGSPAGLTNNIASFQGFFIKTKGTGNVSLYFPMSSSITRPAQTNHQLQSASSINDDRIYINAANKAGNSWATVVVNNRTLNSDIPQLFITTADSKNVPQVYTLNSGKKKNVVQHEQGDLIEVPIGIKCESRDSVTFSFSNFEYMDYKSLTLIDTRLNKTIDLFKQSDYSFKNEANDKERFLLQIGSPKTVTAIDPVNDEMAFRINYHENMLDIQSSEDISAISIFTIQGIRVSNYSNIDTKSFIREIRLPAGIYIVTSKLNNGEIKTKKIITN